MERFTVGELVRVELDISTGSRAGPRRRRR